ncbi:MAG: hypothetical protein ACOC2M_05030 [bacterium]
MARTEYRINGKQKTAKQIRNIAKKEGIKVTRSRGGYKSNSHLAHQLADRGYFLEWWSSKSKKWIPSARNKIQRNKS